MKLIINVFLPVFLCLTVVMIAEGQSGNRKKSHVVFLISEDPDNYEAPRTVPPFAKRLEKEHGMKTTVLLGEGERTAYRFPGFEAIEDADVVVVFCRRLAMPSEQLAMLKRHVASGKPVVGIRTAHHAFSPREQVAKGHEAWPEFPADVLGCENKGYGTLEPGLDVAIVASARKHPILKGVKPTTWFSDGSLYHVGLLDSDANVLLTGKMSGKVEPIAWTRTTSSGGRVFYTSLGYPTDFEKEQINTLIVNGIKWALDRK